MLESSRAEDPNFNLDVTGRPMPPIYLRLSDAYVRYYQVHFQPDGFPARRLPDGGTYDHPLYPTYFMDEYIAQARLPGNAESLFAANLIAEAALRRMSEFEGALVFWYEPDPKVARSFARHYSCLTQTYYVCRFFDLAVLTGSARYFEAAHKLMKGLFIPTDAGGVLRCEYGGKGLEELPMPVPDLILNGWLSALSELVARDELVKKLEITKFLEDNLDFVEALLPLYDCPELLNTRYSLSGFVYVRLRCSSGVRLRFHDPRIALSGRKFSVDYAGKSRWTNYIFGTDALAQGGRTFESKGTTVRLNLVLSQIGDCNTLEFDCEATKDDNVAVEAYVGTYKPLSNGPTEPQWVSVTTLPMSARRKKYRVEFGSPVTNLVGYPTNFLKVIDGVNRNVYHITHIVRLEELTKYQDRSAFRHFATKWRGYTDQWRESPIYQGVADFDYATVLGQPSG